MSSRLEVFREIIDGWSKLAVKDPETEKMASERIRICIKCDDFQENKKCRLCGCFMPAKTRSVKSKCPLNKW